MIKAIFETTNFNFTAYGATEKDAMLVLKKGLKQHGKNCNLPNDWVSQYTYSGKLEMDDVGFVSIEINKAYRDDQLLKGFSK